LLFITCYLSKVANFNLPHPWRMILFEFCRDVRRMKTSVPELLCCLFAWSYVYPFQQNTDFWQTDRHTTTAYTPL